MGLENRKGGIYYYQKVRRGGRVASVYVGGGELGALAARLDGLVARRKGLERLRDRIEVEGSATVDDLVGAYCAGVDAVVAEALEAAGYRRHRRGEWRKRRGE